MTPPLVSFVVAARNAEEFIGETLASLLAQSYPRVEVVVVDDGSSDATAAVVRATSARDPRVRLVTQPWTGVAAARNRAVASSSGAFVAPVDADDVWLPPAAARLVERLERAGPETAVAYAWSAYIDEAGLPPRGAPGPRGEGGGA